MDYMQNMQNFRTKSIIFLVGLKTNFKLRIIKKI